MKDCGAVAAILGFPRSFSTIAVSEETFENVPLRHAVSEVSVLVF